MTEVDSNLLHNGKDLWVYTQAWFRSCGNSFRLRAIGKPVEESSCHLGSSGVVNAGENNSLHYGNLPYLVPISSISFWMAKLSSVASGSLRKRLMRRSRAWNAWL